MTVAPRTFQVSVTRTIPATTDAVYRVLADYEHAHPQILPPSFFVGLTVLEGGYGEGTVFLLRGKAAGKTREIRGLVTEPQPGRLLVESYPEEKMATSFLVEPGEAGSSTVTITTEMPRRAGLPGWIEAHVVRWILTRVFREELDLLRAYVAGSESSLP